MPLQSRLAWPEPRSRNPLIVAARFLWTLPTNVIGHGIGLALSRRLPMRYAGPAASGWFYAIPFRKGTCAAITLGHAILYTPGCTGSVRGPVFAHELAHTRQHDVLGPFYLPAHGIAQVISLVLSFAIRGRVHSRIHAYNPLEQTWICLGASACWQLAQGQPFGHAETERYLALLGVTPESLARSGPDARV